MYRPTYVRVVDNDAEKINVKNIYQEMLRGSNELKVMNLNFLVSEISPFSGCFETINQQLQFTLRRLCYGVSYSSLDYFILRFAE